MALVLTEPLPQAASLADDGIVIADRVEGRPLRILLENLMPDRAATETQMARLLSNSPLNVTLDLYTPAALRPAGDFPGRVASRCLTLSEVTAQAFDGLILSGSPMETVDFEAAPCWDEIGAILAWSEAKAGATMHICLGAMAGLGASHALRRPPPFPHGTSRVRLARRSTANTGATPLGDSRCRRPLITTRTTTRRIFPS